MAHICYKPAGSCKTCEHYKYDREEHRMACFANEPINKEDTMRELIYLREHKRTGGNRHESETLYGH